MRKKFFFFIHIYEDEDYFMLVFSYILINDARFELIRGVAQAQE